MQKKSDYVFQILRLVIIFIFITGFDSVIHNKNSVYENFNECIKRYEYHRAFSILDDLLKEMKDYEEGAANHEYHRLLGLTAGSGQGDWAKIFMDPNIDLKWKVDLVKEIHTNSIIEKEMKVIE